MELGNMIFGNSRGEYPVDRSDWIEAVWERFVARAGINWCGYTENSHPLEVESHGGIENSVFCVRPYDWGADCDCGADDKMEEWFAENSHKNDCYYEELHRRLADAGLRKYKFGDDDYTKRRDSLIEGLCKERGLSYPKGCLAHCDCGHEKDADEEWGRIGGHSDDCRLVQPNFLFKPTGFRLNWYKYPFRDSYSSEPIERKMFIDMLKRCVDSL